MPLVVRMDVQPHREVAERRRQLPVNNQPEKGGLLVRVPERRRAPANAAGNIP